MDAGRDPLLDIEHLLDCYENKTERQGIRSKNKLEDLTQKELAKKINDLYRQIPKTPSPELDSLNKRIDHMKDRESSAWSAFKASASTSNSHTETRLINAAKNGTLNSLLYGKSAPDLSHVSLHVLQQIHEISNDPLIKLTIDQRIANMTTVAVAQFTKGCIHGSQPIAAQAAAVAARHIPQAAPPQQPAAFRQSASPRQDILDFLQTKGRNLEGFRKLIRNYGHFSEDDAVTIFYHLPNEKEWAKAFNDHQTNTEPSAPLLEQRRASPIPPKVRSLGTDLCDAITKGGYSAFAEFQISHIDEMGTLSPADLDTAIEMARKRNYVGIIRILEGYRETAIQNYPLRLSDGSHGSSEKMNFDDQFEKYKKQGSKNLYTFENFLNRLEEPLTEHNYHKVLNYFLESGLDAHTLDAHIKLLEDYQNPRSWGELPQAREGVVEEFKDPGIARAEILEQEAVIPPHSFEEDLIDAAKSSKNFQKFIGDNPNWLSRCSSETLDTMILVAPHLSKQLTDFRETKARFNDEFSRIARGKDSAIFFDFMENNQDNIKNLLSQDTLENLLKKKDLDPIIKETLEVTIKERIMIGFAEILQGPNIQRNFDKCLESISRKSQEDQVIYKNILAEYIEKNPALGLRMPQDRFARIEQLPQLSEADIQKNTLEKYILDIVELIGADETIESKIQEMNRNFPLTRNHETDKEMWREAIRLLNKDSPLSEKNIRLLNHFKVRIDDTDECSPTRLAYKRNELRVSASRDILFNGLSDAALAEKSPRDKLEHIILHGSLSYESMDVDSFDWSAECLDIIQDLVRSASPYSEDSTLQNLLNPERNTNLSPKERVVQIAEYFNFLQTTGRYVPMDDMSFVLAPVRPGMSIQAQASIDRPGSPLQNLHGNLALNEQIRLPGGGSISLDIKEHARINGDGDCYYRAVCIGAIESYLVQPPEKRRQLFNALADKLERLPQAQDFMRTIGYLRGLGSLSSKVTVADFEHLLITHESTDQDLVKAMKYLLAEECKKRGFLQKTNSAGETMQDIIERDPRYGGSLDSYTKFLLKDKRYAEGPAVSCGLLFDALGIQGGTVTIQGSEQVYMQHGSQDAAAPKVHIEFNGTDHYDLLRDASFVAARERAKRPNSEDIKYPQPAEKPRAVVAEAPAVFAARPRAGDFQAYIRILHDGLSNARNKEHFLIDFFQTYSADLVGIDEQFWVLALRECNGSQNLTQYTQDMQTIVRRAGSVKRPTPSEDTKTYIPALERVLRKIDEKKAALSTPAALQGSAMDVLCAGFEISSADRMEVFNGKANVSNRIKHIRENLIKHIIKNRTFLQSPVEIAAAQKMIDNGCWQELKKLLFITPPFSQDQSLSGELDTEDKINGAIMAGCFFEHLRNSGYCNEPGSAYTSISDMKSRNGSPVHSAKSPECFSKEWNIPSRKADYLQLQVGLVRTGEASAASVDMIDHEMIRGDGACYYRAVYIGTIDAFIKHPDRVNLFENLAEKLEGVTALLEADIGKYTDAQKKVMQEDIDNHKLLISTLRRAAQGEVWKTPAEFREYLYRHPEMDKSFVRAMRYLCVQLLQNRQFLDSDGEGGLNWELAMTIYFNGRTIEDIIENIYKQMDMEAEGPLVLPGILPDLLGVGGGLIYVPNDPVASMVMYPVSSQDPAGPKVYLQHAPGHYNLFHAKSSSLDGPPRAVMGEHK